MKRLFILMALFLFISEGSAKAHKVNAYAYREGNKVIGECYFADGSPCKNSRVEVYSSSGNKISELMTDEKGKFSFHISEQGEIKIVIPAGEGHRAEYTLEAVERKLEAKGLKMKLGDEKKETDQEAHMHSMGKEEIRQLMEEVMDFKLQGIKMEIMDLHKKMDKVTLRDIIGGVGFIFGVWGLMMLLKSRKNAS